MHPGNFSISIGKLARLYLVFGLALLAAGVLVGGSLQPARLAVLLALPFCALRFCGGRLQSPVVVIFVLLAYFWLSWGLLSSLWAPDPVGAFAEVAVLGLGLATAFVVMQLGMMARDGMDALRMGWVWAYILTLPLVGIEILTDQHFGENEGGQIAGGMTEIRVLYAAASFGNRNTYCAFLTLCFPFVLWSLMLSRAVSSRLLYAFLAISIVLIVVLNASRLGVAILAIQLFGWWWLWALDRYFWRRFVVGVLVACLVGCMSVIWVLPNLEYTRIRFASLWSGEDESAGARWALMLAGLNMIRETNGVGVGAGGFPVAAAQRSLGDGSGDLRGLVNPHNLWIEVFSQYGVMVGTLFVAWLLICGWSLWRVRRHGIFRRDREVRIAGSCCLLVLCGLPLNALMNSHYMGYTFLWSALGSIIGVSSLGYELSSARGRVFGKKITRSTALERQCNSAEKTGCSGREIVAKGA